MFVLYYALSCSYQDLVRLYILSVAKTANAASFFLKYNCSVYSTGNLRLFSALGHCISEKLWVIFYSTR